jgi:hypothetical protein
MRNLDINEFHRVVLKVVRAAVNEAYDKDPAAESLKDDAVLCLYRRQEDIFGVPNDQIASNVEILNAIFDGEHIPWERQRKVRQQRAKERTGKTYDELMDDAVDELEQRLTEMVSSDPFTHFNYKEDAERVVNRLLVKICDKRLRTPDCPEKQRVFDLLGEGCNFAGIAAENICTDEQARRWADEYDYLKTLTHVTIL